MSEYLHVEKPFLDQLRALGWTVIDQGQGMIPSDPAVSRRTNFREVLLPEVFRRVVRGFNRAADPKPWLTDRRSTTCATSGCVSQRDRCSRSTRWCRPCCSRRRWT